MQMFNFTCHTQLPDGAHDRFIPEISQTTVRGVTKGPLWWQCSYFTMAFANCIKLCYL